MGQDQKDELIFEIRLHKKVEKELKTLVKRHDPQLIKEIEKNIHKLKKQPELGEKLIGDLAECYSIHLEKFKFRIIYKKDDNSRTIIIIAIGNRKNVYDKTKHYKKLIES